MVKKLFALASVTALAGLVSAVGASGCTTTEVVPPSGTGTPDGGGAAADSGKKPDKTTPTTEAGKPPVTETDADVVVTCLNKAPIDATAFPYTKATKAVGACTTPELDALSAFIKTQSDAKKPLLISEWSAKVSAGCSACVFSDPAATTWGPILTNTKEDKVGGVNRGGCIELLSGKESCGKAYQQVTNCRTAACGDCKSQADFDECNKGTQAIFGDSGPCNTAYKLMETECGASLSAYETGCKGATYVVDGPMKVQCNTGGGN